jgi:predicted CoA-binding protein
VKDVVQLFADPAASLAVKSALLKTDIHHSRFWVEQRTADPEAASPVKQTLSVSANPTCSPGSEFCILAE